MSSFIYDFIDKTAGGGNVGTSSLRPDVKAMYTKNLNEINEANFVFSSLSSDERKFVKINNEVLIKRNGTIEFYGVIDTIKDLDGGGLAVHVAGYEVWLTREMGTYANSPYSSSTPTEDIFDDIVGESSYITLGTSANAFSTKFRISKSQTLWNAIMKLREKTGQDVEIDYSSAPVSVTINLINSTGTAQSYAINDILDCKNLNVRKGPPSCNFIRIYGKGDGENQFYLEDSNSTSITAYGTFPKVHVDRTLIDETEAQKLADAILAEGKDPQNYYDLTINNYSLDFSVGDTFSLTSLSRDINAETVRVMSVIREEMKNTEVLRLEVSNETSNYPMRRLSKRIAKIQGTANDQNSYKQGSGNTLTWAQKLNGKSGAPLVIAFNIPSSYVTDEAGDIRVSSFTLDYDIDPFRSNIGSTTESNTSPSLTAGTEADNHDHNVSDTGHNHANSTVTSEVVLGNLGDDTNDESDDLDINFDSSSFTGIGDSFSAPRSGVESYVFHVCIHNDDSGTVYVYLRVDTGTGYYPNSSGIRLRIESGASVGTTLTVPVQAYDQSLAPAKHLQCYVTDTGGSSITGDIDISTSMYSVESHVHSVDVADTASDNATIDEDLENPNVTGAAEAHNHGVTIGDDVTDSGSVNSTELSSIKVYWWNGASWTLKHTISTTGTTIDTDVDLSNGGTLPDAAGFWKVELDPDSSSADLLQGIVKIKHSLDN